nr:hypothetical protein Q903MT_gene6243 [Picea sitchensis]
MLGWMSTHHIAVAPTLKAGLEHRLLIYLNYPTQPQLLKRGLIIGITLKRTQTYHD